MVFLVKFKFFSHNFCFVLADTSFLSPLLSVFVLLLQKIKQAKSKLLVIIYLSRDATYSILFERYSRNDER